jgi:hypothetical protein
MTRPDDVGLADLGYRACTRSILAVIGVVTVILTAAARIPAALAEFLRACVIAAAAARELRTALTGRPLVKTPDPPER